MRKEIKKAYSAFLPYNELRPSSDQLYRYMWVLLLPVMEVQEILTALARIEIDDLA